MAFKIIPCSLLPAGSENKGNACGNFSVETFAGEMNLSAAFALTASNNDGNANQQTQTGGSAAALSVIRAGLKSFSVLQIICH